MRNLHAHRLRLSRRRGLGRQRRRLGTKGLSLEYGRQRVDALVLADLLAWARTCALRSRFRELMAGAGVNGRLPALHTAQRGTPAARAPGISRRMQVQLRKALEFADAVRKRQAHGTTGEFFTDVVNLGVGGSEQGPRLLVEALGNAGPTIHFISGPDGLELERLLACLDPRRTLFIVASKSFSTWETLLNARTARDWLQAELGANAAATHMVGVSAAGRSMRDFGLRRCFRIEPSIGGRYSVWSAMGLAGAISIGARAFREFLEGGRDMDRQVLKAPLAHNPAVLMALLDAWNIQFLSVASRVMLVFDERLSMLVPYLGQLEMESLGKNAVVHSSPTEIAPAALSATNAAGIQGSAVPLWGGLAHAARHSYFQLLYQGHASFTADLVLVRKAAQPSLQPRRDELLRRARKCSELLAYGRRVGSQICPGGRAHNLLWLDALTPRTLGQLLALYEHKVYALSVIWGLNPFNQPFVDAVRR